ncbi:MAG: hypothetical protein HQM09_01655 [Candidatus Riflebacteria bacterium]|nr:hypothetical protein [Candidatus Riflebacteria bacterium]
MRSLCLRQICGVVILIVFLPFLASGSDVLQMSAKAVKSPVAGIARITSKQILPEPSFPEPSAGKPVIDPTFGTSLQRLTDAGLLKQPGVVPDYSKRQAFSPDGKYLLLRNTESQALLFSAKDYSFIKPLEGVAGEDLFWDPRHPGTLLFAIENVLSSCDVVSGKIKEIHRFDGYAFADTRGEGNLSLDGRYYAIACRTYDAKSGDVGYKNLLVFDLQEMREIARLAFPPKIENFDWVSISPRGNYVVVDYADTEKGRFHGVEVYDRNLKNIWQKPLGAGHSDIGLDINGDEVLVMDIYDEQRNQTLIKKFRLSDGKETELFAVSPLFDLHISCRNTARPGWCYISTFDYVQRLTHNANDFLPFEDEIFALSLDGNATTERLAHHHSRRFAPNAPDADHSCYFAEPHASVSPEGDRIIFGSNWNHEVNNASALDTFLIDLR